MRCLAVIPLLLLWGCQPKQAAPVAPAATPVPKSYLVDEPAHPPEGYNPVGNPEEGIAMYCPPGYEWESPLNFFGAMNMVDPTITQGTKNNPTEPIELFDANTNDITPDLYPARIIVQRMPKMDIDEAEADFANRGKDWDYKGRLNTRIGKIPLYEREIDLRGLKGDKLRVLQKRYLMCFEKRGFVVLTYCPLDLTRLAYDLEQAAISVRPYDFATGAEMILPPVATKRESFNSRPRPQQQQLRSSLPLPSSGQGN
jgi:hypothetical protein